MRKAILFVIIGLLFAQAVLAEQMSIEDIRVYQNENRVSNVDKDGGDIQDVRPDDVLEFRIDIHNNDGTEMLNDVLVFGEIIDIDDGSDLEIDLNRFDLRKGETERKVLTFTIPRAAEEDDYDVDLIIRGISYNGTEETYNVTYNLELITSQSDTFNIREALQNITSYCQTSKDDVSYVRTKIDSVVGPNGELQTCQSELATIRETSNGVTKGYDDKVREVEKLQTDWNQCNTDYQSVRQNYDSCSVKLSNASTEINNVRNQASKTNSNLITMLAVGGLVVGGIFWWRKNKGKARIPGFKDDAMSDSRIDQQLGSKFRGAG